MDLFRKACYYILMILHYLYVGERLSFSMIVIIPGNCQTLRGCLSLTESGKQDGENRWSMMETKSH